ncbi:alcohol dehydrogenase catalytic domain-containing protein [Saccharopolyspora phatthalungensis]|uniref:Threonine dehydrogenase-like Zn-dependent dehydrogenase n=1 Tax=Saccharopolyspora phatthalungensis TaxID=664693 RepID=A0A840QE98_9PSEU|nr:alcohol dehydrogenase catalytic domain-containing protein [Saccharopolyspora phatthalungensis]MBB5159124.1 threonine dehydrogenase-like Zn-dependent dehydrogenase [Saccharopolyspora phatthalungensis]
MKAVVVHGPGDLRVETLHDLRVAPDRVVVRVVYGGICGSDLHYAADGRNGPYRITEPLVLGHEVVGVVSQIGHDVANAPAVGTRVAIHPATPTAPPGAARGTGLHLHPGGTYLGSASTRPHTQGGFVELLEVSPGQLRLLPDELPLRRAVLAEPLAVALHGVARLEARPLGARVLVSGAGPIGALAIAALRHAGSAEIVAADLQGFPLKVAAAVGADSTRNLSDGDTVEESSFDIVVEAAGAVGSLVTALDAVRPGGAVLQLGMLPRGPIPVPVSAIIAKEVTLYGSQRFDIELDAAIALLAGDPSLEAVLSHEFDIDSAAEAFACAAESARSSKTVLRMSADPES